jgi:hypothetical protein
LPGPEWDRNRRIPAEIEDGGSAAGIGDSAYVNGIELFVDGGAAQI